jgi:hypothetical protein
LFPEFHLFESYLFALLFLLLEAFGDLGVEVLAVLLVRGLTDGGAGVVLEEGAEGVEGLLFGELRP